MIKKSKTVLHGFIETVDEFYYKPSKWWVNQGKEFYDSPK